MELQMIVLPSLFLAFFVGATIGGSCKSGCKLPRTPLLQWTTGKQIEATTKKSCARNGDFVRLSTAKSADGNNNKYITFICEDGKLRHLRQPSCGDEIVVENVVSDKKGFIVRRCTVRREGMKDLKWHFHFHPDLESGWKQIRGKKRRSNKPFVIARQTDYSFESTLHVPVKEDLMGSYKCVANYKRRGSRPLSSRPVVLKGPQCNTTWLESAVYVKNGAVRKIPGQSLRPMTDNGQSVHLECFGGLPNFKVTCKFGKWTIEKEKAETNVTSACWRCPPPQKLIPKGSLLKIRPKSSKPEGHIGAQYEIYCPKSDRKDSRRRRVTATCVSSNDGNDVNKLPHYEKSKLPECV